MTDAAKPDTPPKAHAVHSRPEETAEGKPLPENVAKTSVEQKSPAQWAYERLILYIRNFEEQLDADHEIALGMTGSNVGTLRIQGLGYFDPDIVTFYGVDQNGSKTQMIQHVTQLTVVLQAIGKMQPDQSAQRIGFRLTEDLEST